MFTIIDDRIFYLHIHRAQVMLVWRGPSPWHRSLYCLWRGNSKGSASVSLSHCVPVPLCPNSTASQSHCVPVPLCPCPTVSQSHCVPVPVPLCPCPTVPVPLSLFHCVPVPLRPSPIVSQSHCVPVLLCPSPIVSLSHRAPVPFVFQDQGVGFRMIQYCWSARGIVVCINLTQQCKMRSFPAYLSVQKRKMDFFNPFTAREFVILQQFIPNNFFFLFKEVSRAHQPFYRQRKCTAAATSFRK